MSDSLPTEDTELTPVDPRYKNMLRLVVVLWALPLIAAAIAAELAGLLPLGVVILPVALLLGWTILRLPLRRYNARGYTMGTDRLRTVRGLLFRSDTVVPFGRVQHLDVHQGPLERAFGLATLVLHTAGNHNASVAQPGLRHDDAIAMREAIRGHIKRQTL